MKLNLGCGRDIRRGYVNVDQRRLAGVDQVADLGNMPWPFDTESADEVLMLDFLEHFPYQKTSVILIECHRILRPGGQLLIQVPDADHLSLALTQVGEYLCNSCGQLLDSGYREYRTSCQACGQSFDDITEAAMKRLYGGQDYPGNFHYTCFTKKMLVSKATKCGFVFLDFEERKHQYENWNFCARFKKGELW